MKRVSSLQCLTESEASSGCNKDGDNGASFYSSVVAPSPLHSGFPG